MPDTWEGAGIVTRMLRIWHASRSIGENPLPLMQVQAAPIVVSPEFASACDSLFMLTEAVLGRSLVPARCCSPHSSRDERAVLAMLRHAPSAGTLRTNAAVPHGLPSALRWAAFAVLRTLGDRLEETDVDATTTPTRCPFDNDLDVAA